jgi:hypothetical protein
VAIGPTSGEQFADLGGDRRQIHLHAFDGCLGDVRKRQGVKTARTQPSCLFLNMS